MKPVIGCELTKREKELMALAWDEMQFADLFPKDIYPASTVEQIYEDIIQAARRVSDKELAKRKQM